MRRFTTLAVVGVLLCTGACSDNAADEPDTNSARPTAERLVAGLASLDVDEVNFDAPAGQVARRLSTAVGSLADEPPAVELASLEESGSRASATLQYAWDVDADGEPDWTYQAPAELRMVQDAWQVTWKPTLLAPRLRPGAELVVVATAADRGDILGAGEQVLVTERPVYRVGIDKTRVALGRQRSSARSLAGVVDVDAEAFATEVAATGPDAFAEAIVLRETDLPKALSRRIDAVPGAVQLPDELPLAPTREFAAPVLGSVGEATAEMIEDSDGRLQVGDLAGVSGLQERYDERLAGVDGFTVEVRSDDPTVPSRVLFRSKPTGGEPVRTTVDLRLQMLAEGILVPTTSPSALVAVRPSSGDVVAVASGLAGEGLSTATDGRYPPGSTFKVVSALALLRDGLTSRSMLPCARTTTVDGKQFGNYSDYPDAGLGTISLREALAYSCNTAFVTSRGRAPMPQLSAAAASLGLGVDRDLGSPAFLGSVPTRAGSTEHAASMIGQGRVEASPLAMATVAASVAAGETVVPRLVTSPAPGGGGPARPERPLTAAEARDLRDMMRAVVTTGSATFLGDVPGGPVRAKTGTAEYGTAVPPRTHAWMIATQGDLAVAVFVQEGESGSATAGPLLEQFLRRAR